MKVLCGNFVIKNGEKEDFNIVTDSNRFDSVIQIAAMACGLTGKEYGLITGFKSHYNLSWTIRHKLGLPERTSNLRLFLQGGNFRLHHESSESIAPK